MFDKIKIYLEEALTIKGDIIDFRMYDGFHLVKIINAADTTGKRIYGLETFHGLNPPTYFDINYPQNIEAGQYAVQEITTRTLISRNTIYKNYALLKTNYNDLDRLGLSDLYCFAIIDLKQYEPTKLSLAYIWDKMNYGGTLFISHFDDIQNHSQYAAIKEFLILYSDSISVSKQSISNEHGDHFIAIKCYNPKFKPISHDPIDFKTQPKITIATVLKTGGVYDYKYVNALAKAIKANVGIDHEFVCLTNDSTGFSSEVDKTIRFVNDYPKWWGKIELFNPHLFNTDQIFYFDLDTSIIDNIDDIVSYNGDFAGLRDFYALHSFGSGVMSWNRHKNPKIYYDFLPVSQQIIDCYTNGDQQWIGENRSSIDYLQDIYHRNIVSFKRHCFINNTIIIPEHAKIVCFHGNPRPHTIQNDILKKYW